MVGVGASKLRRAATKLRRLRLPCGGGSLSPATHFNDNAMSKSSVVSTKSKNYSARTGEDPASTATKNLCPICLELLTHNSPSQAIFTAQCTHSFHYTCISSNVRHGSVTCPICRAHWTQLPHPVNPPPHNHDPILRILDDSIANFRVHRRSSLRSACYNDDDPIEPLQNPWSNHNRLHFTLVPLEFSPSHHFASTSSGSPTYLCANNSSSSSSNGNAAASLSVTLAQQQPTDLVLVASPNGSHLRLLKQSMALVVFSLRSIDRLAIVTATRAFPLRRMTCHGKRTALQVIDRLLYTGDADPGPGVSKGIKILEDRAHQNPHSTILHLSDSPTPSHGTPLPVHQFHVGFDYGASSCGIITHEFEEFLARILGGVIKDTQLRIGEDGEVVRLGELRGGEERRIPLFLDESDQLVCVSYSYIDGGQDQCLTTGEIEVGLNNKGQSEFEQVGGRVGRSSSSAENWDYHDPYMARRWAKHLHGYRL